VGARPAQHVEARQAGEVQVERDARVLAPADGFVRIRFGRYGPRRGGRPAGQRERVRGTRHKGVPPEGLASVTEHCQTAVRQAHVVSCLDGGRSGEAGR
jgi:hypothetical protein